MLSAHESCSYVNIKDVWGRLYETIRRTVLTLDWIEAAGAIPQALHSHN